MRADGAAGPAGDGDDDQALVERARGGDAEAFRGLVLRHQHRAVGLALRLTGERGDAEEVAQDAFVRAWRALPSFRGEAAFATWLHRIVTRVALDRRAAAARRRGREVGLDEAALEAEAAAVAAGAGDAGEDALTARTRAALLAGLGEAQRAVVTLHYLEDVPVLEVARLLGLPENTVKTHLARARAAMRETWRREAARGKGALRA